MCECYSIIIAFNELHSHLIAHDILLKSHESHVVNFTQRLSQSSHKAIVTTSSMNNSTLKSSSSYSKKPQRDRGPCQICNLSNHTADRCRRRYELSTHNNQSAQANVMHIVSPSSRLQQLSWLVDSGTNYHVTHDLALLHQTESYIDTNQVRVGNGQSLDITHVGKTYISHYIRDLNLNNILCVPSIFQNLLSINRLCVDNNCYFEFWPSLFCVHDQGTKQTILTRLNKDGLYVMPSTVSKQATAVTGFTYDD